MDQASRAAMERLRPFIGEWRMEASFPPAATAALVGRAVFEWTLDGQFLVERLDVPRPDVPDGLCIIGPGANGQAYTQHYFDSRGVVRVYAMTFGEGLWTLVRDTPDFTALDVSQRFTARFSPDGATIEGRWETSADGSRWELDFNLRYTRIT